jgi:hypothetical protein
VLRPAPGAPKALFGELGCPLELPQAGSRSEGAAIGPCAIQGETLAVMASRRLQLLDDLLASWGGAEWSHQPLSLDDLSDQRAPFEDRRIGALRSGPQA